MDTRCDVILLAAGLGRRLGHDAPKARVALRGAPLFLHALRAFDQHPRVDRIVLVGPVDREELAEFDRIARVESSKVTHVVAGGEERQDSSRAGLAVLLASKVRNDRIVLIHDAARPIVPSVLIDRCLDALSEERDAKSQAALPGLAPEGEWGSGPAGAIPGLPIRETLKLVFDARVVMTQPRDGLFAIQTPQAFRFGPIWKAHQKAEAREQKGTDDASLLEWMGISVRVVEGEGTNLKVTYPEDLLLAEQLLAGQFASSESNGHARGHGAVGESEEEATGGAPGESIGESE